MHFVYKNIKRAPIKNSLRLLSASALIALSAPYAYAQKAGQARIINPAGPWEVTDNSQSVNPACLMQRRYDANIFVSIKSNTAGSLSLAIENPPSSAGEAVTAISIGAEKITNIKAANGANISAQLEMLRDNMASFYQGESITLHLNTQNSIDLPIQSTALAEARMSLCIETVTLQRDKILSAAPSNMTEQTAMEDSQLIDSLLRGANKAAQRPSLDKNLSELAPVVLAVDDNIPMPNEMALPDPVIEDAAPALNDLSAYDEITEQAVSFEDDLTQDINNAALIEDISAQSETTAPEATAETRVAETKSVAPVEINDITEIDAAPAASIAEEMIANPIAAPQEPLEQDIEQHTPPTEELIVESSDDIELSVEDLISETKTDEPAIDTLVAQDIPNDDEAASTEDVSLDDIAQAVDSSVSGKTIEEVEAKTQTENLDDELNRIIEDSLSSEQISQPSDEVIASKLDTVRAPKAGMINNDSIAMDHGSPADPSEEIVIEQNMTEQLEQASTDNIDNEMNLEDFGIEQDSQTGENDEQLETMADSDILDALDHSLNEPAIEDNALAAPSTASPSTDNEDNTLIEQLAADDSIAGETSQDISIALEADSEAEGAPSTDTDNIMPVDEDDIFDDTLSIEVAEDDLEAEGKEENLADELADEDFSDEELIALLDDPDALSDDFAEIMVEEEFKQVPPMEGIRDMIGLGTPEEIKYTKVPWLIEEDADQQWKHKVRMLEREKEMLRLRLADTNANPLADLIARKRNKRTQEELVEKIRALEAENRKLKKGLILSKQPEEFIDDDKLDLRAPDEKMRLGTAQPTEIDLIDQDIDTQLDSLETRMDAFLRGIGEDYALANADKVSPLSSSSLTQDIIDILKKGYVVDPDSLKIRSYRHKSTGTAVTAWEAGDLQGRAERTVLPPNKDFTAYVDRFLNAAQLRCHGNFTAVPDTSTRNLRALDLHCNDGALGQRSSVIFVKHGSIITAIATTTNLPKGGSDFLRDIRKRLIEGIRLISQERAK